MTSTPLLEVWLTADDIVALGRSRRKVLVNISTGKWPSREVGRGRNGKPRREVAFSSLPSDLQARYLEQQRAQAIVPDPAEAVIVDTPVPPISDEIRLIEALKRYPADVREAMLNEAGRLAGIVERYDAIEVKRRRKSNLEAVGSNPTVRSWTTDVAEMADAPDTGSGTANGGAPAAGFEFVPAVFALCAEAKCTDPVILKYYEERRHKVREGAKISRAQSPSPRTLDGWSRRYKTDGLLTFLRAPSTEPGQNKRDGRRAAISPAAVEWVNLNHRLCATARALYRKLQKQARRNRWTIPSESWVYRRWKARPAIVTSPSQKDYVSKFAPYVSRDYRDLEALQILCGDHSLRDVTVRLPDGSLTRPWLTWWQDMRTGLIYGWHLDTTPSSVTIGLAYAAGVATFGAQPIARSDEDFFSYLYTDQGKDYKSHNIAGKLLSFPRAAAIEGGLGALCTQRKVGLMDDLGLKQLLARGYNAREKPVERTHRDLSTWEQNTFEPEYCGRDAKNKPDAWKAAWARHERLLKRASNGRSLLLDDSPFMPLDDYRDALTGWIDEYNHTAHERATLGGASVVPIEEYQRLYTTRYEISEQALALLLMKAVKRVVGKNGVRLFQQGWSYLHSDLALYKGTEVEVRYSESDYSHVWIIPSPTPAIPNPAILQAQLITATGVLNPNKETVGLIAKQRKHEEKTIKDFQLITQSQIRGESVEDRVAQLIEPEEVAVPERIAMAGGGSGGVSATAIPGGSAPARVHQLTRLDRQRLRGPMPVRPVTVDEVASATVDESMFAKDHTPGDVVRMWEDEE